MAVPKRDGNFVPVLFGVSSADGVTPLPFKVDPGTGRLLVLRNAAAPAQNRAPDLTKPVKKSANYRSVLVGETSDGAGRAPFLIGSDNLMIQAN